MITMDDRKSRLISFIEHRSSKRGLRRFSRIDADAGGQSTDIKEWAMMALEGIRPGNPFVPFEECNRP
jgi:hypothetical protein